MVTDTDNGKLNASIGLLCGYRTYHFMEIYFELKRSLNSAINGMQWRRMVVCDKLYSFNTYLE